MKQLKKMALLAVLILSIFMNACAPSIDEEEEQKQQPEESTTPSEEASEEDELKTIFENAKQGKIAESPFNISSTMIKEVKREWGEPDKVDEAGYGFYADYSSEKITIGFNQENEVFDLRSYDERLHEITSSMIVANLGVPTKIRNNDNEDIYLYELDNGFELKLILEREGNTVDHISVFNSERTGVVSQRFKQSYSLDIKGESNQLTAEAWKNMQYWRAKMVLFVKNHENMFINGPDRRKVALTFDDGPDEMVTQQIIDILKEYDVKGNFFFLGSKVEEYPQVVHNAYQNGNLILSHSYHHTDLSTMSNEEMKAEIDQAGSAINSVIGKKPAIIRPPYGATNEEVAQVSQQEGYSIVLWSIDTLDWSQKEADHIVDNVVNNLRNGDIILMHSNEDKAETAKALPRIIETLREQNFEIVDLEELLGIKAYQ